MYENNFPTSWKIIINLFNVNFTLNFVGMSLTCSMLYMLSQVYKLQEDFKAELLGKIFERE